jgi:50S ribosomal protein L16 3-hydroxylase
MNVDQALDLLGGLSPAQFMRRHWQKKPLLVRQAMPGFKPLLSRAELFALAAREGVESRLLRHGGGRWALRRGPLPRRAAAAGPARVDAAGAGVDLHHAGVHALMQRFRFVPDARLDDVMISYATDGGGVGRTPTATTCSCCRRMAGGAGASGGRRTSGWSRAAAQDPGPLRARTGMGAGARRHALPAPGWAHDGVALGECMTYSVGFRQPARGELARELLQRLADEASDALGDAPYRDPGQGATATPGAVPEAMLDFARAAVQRLAGDEDMLAMLLGEWLTEPKPDVWFEAAPDAGTDPARGLRLDRRTRMMYDGQHVFINGGFRASGRDAELMCRLADAHVLPAAQRRRLSAPARGLLAEWLQAGWLHEHD